MPNRRSTLPLIGTLAYALAAAGWIIVGFFLSSMVDDDGATSLFELYKGLAFVAFTSAVLFLVLRRLDQGPPAEATFGEITEEFRQSIRVGERTVRWLPAGLATIITALLALLLLGLWWTRENTLAAGERSAHALRHTVAAQTGSALRVVELTLADIANDLAAERPLGDPDAELRRRLGRVATLVRAIWVTDHNGRMIHDSDRGALGIDLSKRDYFRHHRGNPSSGFHVGDPVSSITVGSWFVSASYPVRGSNGEFRGVVVAALDVQRFGSYWQLPGLDQDGSIALFRDDSMLLMRSPHVEADIGKTYRHALAWRELVPGQENGIFRATSAIDGTARIFGFGRIPEYPRLLVFVGIAENQLLSAWRRLAAISIGSLLIIIGVVVAMAIVLLRQLQMRIQSQKKASQLARYPLQNRNPVLSVSRSGERRFMNDAARQLMQSTRGTAESQQLDRMIQEIATAETPGSREFTVGRRAFSAWFVPHPPEDCDIYLLDITTLRRGEQILQQFFDLPFIGMATSSPENRRWLSCNDRLCEILGYPREQLLQKTWTEMTHPDDLAADLAQFEKVMHGEADCYAMDKRFLRPDGSTVYAAIDVRAVRRPDRSIEHFICTVQDISERKQRELDLGRERNLYAALSATNEAIIRLRDHDAIFGTICRVAVEKAGFAFAWIGLVDAESQQVRPAARFGDDHGYIEQLQISINPEKTEGRGVTGLVVREGKYRIVNDIPNTSFMRPWHAAAQRAGVQSSAAFPIRRGGQVVGTLNLYARQRDYFDADIVGLLDEMAADISHALDFIENEQRLRESETKFKGLVEQSLVGIFIVDRSTVVYANPRTAEILGYAPDEIAGTPLQALIHPDERPAVADRIDAVLSGRHPDVRHEFRALRKDGSIVHIGAHGSRTEYRGRAVAIGVLQDITQRLQSEQQIAGYVAQLERSISHTVDAISQIVELRDPYTSGHERRVGDLAAAIGRELGLDEQRTTGLRIAGNVHDVGKVTIPAEILSKPGKLSAAEYAIVKTHAEKGYDILKGIDFPWPVARTVLQHHERLDGSGYPRGLKGEEIMLEARILAVADTLESMSTHRPYRPALGIEEALREILAHAGSHYDPQVVAVAQRLFREQGYHLPE